jgi:hypothetical protein
MAIRSMSMRCPINIKPKVQNFNIPGNRNTQDQNEFDKFSRRTDCGITQIKTIHPKPSQEYRE